MNNENTVDRVKRIVNTKFSGYDLDTVYYTDSNQITLVHSDKEGGYYLCYDIENFDEMEDVEIIQTIDDDLWMVYMKRGESHDTIKIH